MSEITRYVLVDRDDHEQDYEYETLDGARVPCDGEEFAIIERTYTYDDSELVWTPNGATTWPPTTDDET